ncbi:uncharacterized protein A4U43_C01F35670 [Asparagus officinalis]|uniref:Pentatricopeptide repeat-containing protein n=1 Tax=Asparagus officinalis TaxID=4686 RepID=A0A5P1FUQ7_ASPOF|nr:pentatricopeptide repeat-containing protein At4g16470 [Asparagus officinalis]XP_020269346.1 pentatricopeptide repeat-containing protein At4g16470 [Asparagus officinalis]ONK82056.1 uncharacterized protein A4U43_C01F35670 [Asparagus officinalis]
MEKISVGKNFHLELMRRIKLIRELCFSGKISEAVKLLFTCDHYCDPQTYAFLLQETINLKESKLGRRIHTHMIINGHVPNHYLTTKLAIFYAKTGVLDSARYLFDEMPHRGLVPWNAIISGYVQNGLEQQGLDLYYSMRVSGLCPDHFTFASVFRACAGLAKLEHGKRAHCVMMKIPKLRDNVVVSSALIDMYFKCTSPCDGRRVFERASDRNVVSWTALISGYGNHGNTTEALYLFHRMIEEGTRPNYVTFLAVLSACSHGGFIDAGWKYFNSMEKEYGIIPKGEHYASMIDMLGRAGKLEEAFEFIKKSPCKEHSVVWGALLGACRIHGDEKLGKIVAETFFELQPDNIGKHIVLSNTYAALDMWEKSAELRQSIGMLGTKKEPALSSVEVKGEVWTFLVGDKSHEESEMIYETLNALNFTLMEGG